LHIASNTVQIMSVVMLQRLILTCVCPHTVLPRFNHEAFKFLLAQTAAEALMKLGIRASGGSYVLNMPPMVM
jgi:hypothetical protein